MVESIWGKPACEKKVRILWEIRHKTKSRKARSYVSEELIGNCAIGRQENWECRILLIEANSIYLGSKHFRKYIISDWVSKTLT